jgi:hypothetical protein
LAGEKDRVLEKAFAARGRDHRDPVTDVSATDDVSLALFLIGGYEREPVFKTLYELSRFQEGNRAFFWVDHGDGSASLNLNTSNRYKNEVFATRSGEGFRGNGYDWESLALVFLEERMWDFVGKVEFDPETRVSRGKVRFDSEGGIFSVYSEPPDVDILAEFALEFKAACENDALVADLFSRAKADHILTPERCREIARELLEEMGKTPAMPENKELREALEAEAGQRGTREEVK